VTYEYSAPERLEDDWRSGEKTPPGVMLSELSDDVERVIERMDGDRLIPVEGRVSDYKSWLAAAVAMRLSSAGVETTVFVPQRANRESAVDKLGLFGADTLEHPGRIDLCVWEPWREEVGRVDRATCESNGCPYFLGSGDEVEARTEDALSVHAAAGGGSLDADGMKRLGESHDFCPAQLYLQARSSDYLSGYVNTATYAKAFADAAVSDDDPLGSDVLLMDEAHTVAAEPAVVTDDVEPAALVDACDRLTSRLDGAAERWAQRTRDEVEQLQSSIRQWADEAAGRHVNPDGVFEGDAASLSDAFEALDRADSRLMQSVRRAVQRSDWDEASSESDVRGAVGALRGFLSDVSAWRSGDADFVHNLYEERGETVSEMSFRAVEEPADGSGVAPSEVWDEWRERGTHPAIEARWGPLLDRHIEALWEGHAVVPGGDSAVPGAPVEPVERLRQISGADTAVTLSATHNEASDPTRDPGRLRPTRHRLLAAPVVLRADGSARRDYDGRDSVSPTTPWFRDMVEAAAEASGDSLAAVPINYANASSWESMPVESLETADGTVHGVVPNSRGSIGEKGLESMEIDTVVCGVQVQSPAPTARRVIRWWEMLAPRRDSAERVLDETWRLLAQHAVSGTIQAGGRFDWNADNLVFERPELIELAGFEVERAGPGSGGFAGEFCGLYRWAEGEWADKRAANRAKKVVRYLSETDGRAPTPNQTTSEYARIYGTDEPSAASAVRTAAERGLLEKDGDYLTET